MKFTCLQENLSKGLSTVAKAVPVKSSLPILSNILIEAKDGKLKLSATNLETAITTSVGASVDVDGAITVPAKLLQEFVSHLSPDTVSGELKGTTLHLSTEHSKAKFNGMKADDYPELPQMIEDAPALELDPKAFSSAVSVVAFASAVDETRPILGGALLSYSDGVLTVVSADGFRLSEKILNLEAKGKLQEFSVVVPAKTVIEVARIFSSSEEPIKLVLDSEENLALFEAGEVLIATRILDGEYPDYKKIIPEGHSVRAEFSADDLNEAVRLANVFAKEMDSVIKMVFDPKGIIRLSSISKETGENENEIEAVIEADEVLEVSFNSQYLLDLLSNVKAEKFVFESEGSLSAGVIRPHGEEGYTHLIMPIRVQG